VRRVTKGEMVIRGTTVSLGGSQGGVQAFPATRQCRVLTEQVVQDVFDLNPIGPA
jgi:hypothetical protein